MNRPKWRRRGWIATGLVVAMLVCTVAAFLLSPRPMLVVLGWLFDRGAAQASQALAPTPAPPGGHALLVWIHGGAWMSGRKEDVANYLRIVAARGGLAAASLDYTLAPDAVHPTQLQQVHAGLRTLRARAASLGIDPQRIVLAGDSAGAQLAAQLAAAITDPAYGAQLGVPAGGVDPGAIRGTALFCGPFDLALFRLDGPLGPVLRALGVPVQTLYFPDDHTPPLGHEYQFTLDEPAGEMALQRLLGFLAERLR